MNFCLITGSHQRPVLMEPIWTWGLPICLIWLGVSHRSPPILPGKSLRILPLSSHKLLSHARCACSNGYSKFGPALHFSIAWGGTFATEILSPQHLQAYFSRLCFL